MEHQYFKLIMLFQISLKIIRFNQEEFQVFWNGS